MRVGLTGYNGFLASKLRNRQEIEWVDGVHNVDCLFLLGSPTFTGSELTAEDGKVMHSYVKQTVELIDNFKGHIAFASTTGVDDISLDHDGSTSYNLAKLYLENYIISNCSQYQIFRIGTIYSNSRTDVDVMKPDRIQPRIMRKDIKGIPFKDHYLDVDVFVQHTVDTLRGGHNGIFEYALEEKTIAGLMVK